MNKKAILYIRVSTDEQAEKGYSLQDQEERLYKYCENKGIEVVALYKDYYSAKTFDRPEFKKLLEFIRLNKNNVNYLIFTKWDRFSRNAGDSYAMISTLYKYNVEPQAIEQPLDLSIPENKMMLAFYLAAPEVENDRRSLNVIRGMRKARKEGRWMAKAPIGYLNKRDINNNPIIVPGPLSPFIKRAFNEMALGTITATEIRINLGKDGFKISKSNFFKMITNPAYMGKIFVPAYKGEEA
ncbi:MAG: recombinase family protein [Bacteroidota bacterium]